MSRMAATSASAKSSGRFLAPFTLLLFPSMLLENKRLIATEATKKWTGI